MPFHIDLFCLRFLIFAFGDFTLEFTSSSFNDLLIDDTPMMHASNNSTRPNESSLEDELDNDEEELQDEENAQKNGLDSKTLLITLMKQINLLHETNTKIFRNLHETKGKWVSN